MRRLRARAECGSHPPNVVNFTRYANGDVLYGLLQECGVRDSPWNPALSGRDRNTTGVVGAGPQGELYTQACDDDRFRLWEAWRLLRDSSIQERSGSGANCRGPRFQKATFNLLFPDVAGVDGGSAPPHVNVFVGDSLRQVVPCNEDQGRGLELPSRYPRDAGSTVYRISPTVVRLPFVL